MAYATDTVSTAKSGSFNWSNANAWTPTGVPNNNGTNIYDVVFNGKTVGNNEDTLTLNQNVTIQNFTMGGTGLLQKASSGGPYTLTINSALNWTGGAISANVIEEAAGSISPTSTCQLGIGTLDNQSYLTYTSTLPSPNNGAYPLTIEDNGVILNEATATFDIASDAGIGAASGGGVINNQGLFVKSAGTGISEIIVGFTNSGTVRAQSGTLEFIGGASTFTGSVQALMGATIAFDGSSTFSPGAALGGDGTIQFGEYVTFGGMLLGGVGPLQIHNNGQEEFTPTANISSLALSATNGGRAMSFYQEGTASFDTGNTVSIYNLSSNNSFIPGSNTLIVLTGGDNFILNGPCTWTGGTFASSATNGATTITVNAPMTATGFGLDHRTLVNNSTISWTGGFIQIDHTGGLNNNLGGVLDVQSDSELMWGPAVVQEPNNPYPAINNAGLIVKSGGTGEAQLYMVQLLNTGTVRVASGQLTLWPSAQSDASAPSQPGASVNSGVFEACGPGILAMVGVTMDASSTEKGSGTLQFEADNYVLGNYNVSGTTLVYGGVAFMQGATVSNVGQTLNLNGGGVSFNTGKPITLNNVIDNGILDGSDPITINGKLSGSGTIAATNVTATGNVSPGNSPGTLALAGNLTLASTAVLTMELASKSSYDVLTASNTISISGNLALDLLGGYVPNSTDTFTIVSAGNPLSGDFEDVAPEQRLITGDGTGSFLVNYGDASPYGSSEIVLSNFQTIPEPASSTALALASSLLLRRRRAKPSASPADQSHRRQTR
jgi:hypothetical protein